MKRQAILIHSFGPEDDNDFRSGVTLDTDNFYRFLSSSTGGGWKKDEIILLRNPSKSTLLMKLSGLRGADISYIFYSGHGYSNTQTDFLNINPREYISIDQLWVKEAKRQIIISDACRPIPFSSFLGHISGFGEFEFDRRNIALARQFYDKLILASPKGKLLLSSSSKGQNSYSDPDGGVFSKALFRAIKVGSENKDLNFFTYKKIFPLVKKMTRDGAPSKELYQKPTIVPYVSEIGGLPFFLTQKMYLNSKSDNPSQISKHKTDTGEKILTGLILTLIGVGIVSALSKES